MNISKLIAFAALAAAHLAVATPTITDVTAQQHYPWDGKVDITYTVSGDIAATAMEQGLITSLKVTAKDGDTGQSYTASSLSGDASIADGTHSIVWDMGAQGLAFISTNVVFSVLCEATPATYCVIDLSAGANASSYPVTYLAEPPSGGFNADEYKTTKLVLKRIEAGTFIMGEDQSDQSHRVTLTKPFYIGLFEVTQKQYEFVIGRRPSEHTGDKRPVEKVSYVMIRGSQNGAKWPASQTVDSTSFMGLLQTRTGSCFDLPTEAQWEYACRAGTTNIYNNGGSLESDLDEIGRYSGNEVDGLGGYSCNHTTIGTYMPNAWGLYDMLGNVQEWCLDWYGSLTGNETDPVGPATGPNRVRRGGGWRSSETDCTTSYRASSRTPDYKFDDTGFRIARTVFALFDSACLCSGNSLPTAIDPTPSSPIILPSGGVVGNWPLSISISCSTEGATIYYTTDGSEPTVESTVYRRFRVLGRTTVKAVAIKNGVASEIAVAEYAAGQCADPVITPVDGVEFEHVGQAVTIAWSGEDGVLRYTTDGSDPTPTSPIYNGPFTIDDSTVVKAKAFGDQYFDSAIVTANLTRVWVNVATPAIAAASSFTGSETKVSLSCATPGATIYYTLNGSDPNSHSTRYTGPFYVTDSCTVKAYATCYDYLDSAVTTHIIAKVWGIGDTVGAPDHTFATGGDLPFVRVTDNTAPLGESMKSGAITHSQTSTLSTTVMGPGTISFQWKTSCEKDPDDWYAWDHAEFSLDGTVVARLDGESGWQTVSQTIAGEGTHTLLWKYIKDDMESEGEDCCWVADYHWASDLTETQTTKVPVPYAWLRGFFPHTPDEYDTYEAAAKDVAANGLNKVWECYVAGLNPTNATDVFRTVISIGADGAPVIGWEPKLSAAEEAKRTYTIYGRESLTDGDWGPTNAASRFFRVKVSMP